MRSALIVSFAAALAIMPLVSAGAADKPADKPVARQTSLDPSDCTREPVVGGRQLQPKPSDLACLNGGKPLQPAAKAKQVDRDEADIMGFIKRSANQPPLEGAEH
jgi:hypothetical protein